MVDEKIGSITSLSNCGNDGSKYASALLKDTIFSTQTPSERIVFVVF